ncbi:MAG TPA: GGDEF domain-containing protein, partial [Rhodopila sp.]|nr:GGDEF domain-containing protein [Rhodopila sp.]
NSRDRLDLSTCWGKVAPQDHADHFGPNECWALKLGKPYVSGGHASLVCQHAMLGRVTLEIPMAARGEIYGLLQITCDGEGAEERLDAIRPLAGALADAMSLSLSSNALRDQLRNQALRDGLTGLYNRRFLEEMLDRLTLEAQRRNVPLSAIMIDLDHFKRLNDQHGHSAGDAALREVARIVMASVRVTDIACRYGGEELLVLLPDCSLDHAAQVAEQLRLRIESLSDLANGQSVTASFGVASTADSATQPGELVKVADAALYQAKRLGRNRVEVANGRMEAASRVSLVPPSEVAALRVQPRQ